MRLIFTGFTGKFCSKIKKCTENPCQHNGICRTERREPVCDCPQNFEGETCFDDVNECRDYPCLNGGVCINTRGSFHCKCPMYHTGKLCGDSLPYDYYEKNPICVNGHACENNGTCVVDSTGAKSCDCLISYKGLYCEIDVNECKIKPCKNGATCVNFKGGYVCNCPKTYTGSSCGEEVEKVSLAFYKTVSNVCAFLVHHMKRKNSTRSEFSCTEKPAYNGHP